MVVSWRRFNAVAAAAWLLVIPPALAFGWLRSVVFVSAISLYANVAAHIAAWRSDVPTPTEEEP